METYIEPCPNTLLQWITRFKYKCMYLSTPPPPYISLIARYRESHGLMYISLIPRYRESHGLMYISLIPRYRESHGLMYIPLMPRYRESRC